MSCDLSRLFASSSEMREVNILNDSDKHKVDVLMKTSLSLDTTV